MWFLKYCFIYMYICIYTMYMNTHSYILSEATVVLKGNVRVL